MNKIIIISTILMLSVLGVVIANVFDRNHEQKQLRIGINPWPGYEFLYLAERKGFFKEEGIDVRMVQFSSLQDVRQAYEHGNVDGMCVTLIEVLQAYAIANRKSEVIIVADYSMGADAIVARKPIANISDLKGKNIGVEAFSSGEVILARALDKNGLKLSDVNVLNIAQIDINKSLLDKKIDAAVVYPPFSIDIVKNENIVKIFDTTKIPEEILDVVAISQDAIKNNPDVVNALRRVWRKSLDYAHNNPQESYAIMAEREGITVDEFTEALKGIVIPDDKQQKELFLENGKLEENINFVAKVLNKENLIKVQDFIYRENKK